MPKFPEAIFLIAFFVAFLLGGCGRKEVTDLPVPDATAEDAGRPAADETKIPEHLSYTVEQESGTRISVDADVSAEGYGKASIYSLKSDVIDDAWMDNLAKGIFDEGDYEVIKPYRICSMEELLSEQEMLKNRMENNPNYYDGVGFWGDDTGMGSLGASIELDYYISNFDESKVQEFPAGEILYTNEEGTDCRIRGYIDGEYWELHYVSDEGRTVKQELPNYFLWQKDCIMLYPMDWSGEYDYLEPLDADYAQNSVSYNEACETAEDWLYRMGLDDMEIAEASQLANTEGETWSLDGYRLVYTKKLDGIQGVYGQNPVAVREKQDDEEGVCQESVRIMLNKDGIYRVCLSAYYEEEEKMSDSLNMLGFDQIKEIADTYLKGEIYPYAPIAGTEIISVRLGYAALSYDGEYSLIPVWVFLSEVLHETRIEFAVNAIDGEVISFDYDYNSY